MAVRHRSDIMVLMSSAMVKRVERSRQDRISCPTDLTLGFSEESFTSAGAKTQTANFSGNVTGGASIAVGIEEFVSSDGLPVATMTPVMMV